MLGRLSGGGVELMSMAVLEMQGVGTMALLPASSVLALIIQSRRMISRILWLGCTDGEANSVDAMEIRSGTLLCTSRYTPLSVPALINNHSLRALEAFFTVNTRM